MRASAFFLFALVNVGVCGGAAPSVAATADSTSTLYALVTPPSSLTVGCQAPCECPAYAQPLFGSFTLTRTSIGPLYTTYAVERFIASFNNGPGAVAITGAGTYRVGGEVALLQQLVLDLDVEGQPTQHYDSGLVPLGAGTPRIAVACAVHGFYCFDSVLTVSAQPVGDAGVDSVALLAGQPAVRPNPFRGSTLVSYGVAIAGPVEVFVVDLAGRRVRTLLSASRAESGPGHVVWEGRRDDGRRAPAGVYWVVQRSRDALARRRIVKLD